MDEVPPTLHSPNSRMDLFLPQIPLEDGRGDQVTMKQRLTAHGTTLVLFVSFLLPALAGCSRGRDSANCIACHRGLEQASASHPSCLSCHGGNPQGRDPEAAHRGMSGPRNPAAPAFWDKSCGPCHSYQLGRVKSQNMQTNAGMIRNIQLTWE